MKTARFVLIPTGDAAAQASTGWRLPRHTAGRPAAVYGSPRFWRLFGVALFRVEARATHIERETRDIITDMLGQAAPVFTTRIRHQAAQPCPHSIASACGPRLERRVSAQKQRLASLRGDGRNRRHRPANQRRQRPRPR